MERPSDEFLKDAYLRGFDHGSDGYVRSTADAWEEAAYSIGWEDGAQIPSTRKHLPIGVRIVERFEATERIIERFRAMHGSRQSRND